MTEAPKEPGGNLRVLIADDNRDTALTLGILLRSEGIEVRLALGGAEVVTAVREFSPHAVLLDLVMPDRNGLEVARDLKASFADRCPVLIAITGKRADKARKVAEHSGFRHVVLKPYDPDALLRLIASVDRAN